ncbi:MAG: peptide chain release factor N(5)-glutamine methyltransferase [Elusimicrobiota bacterium]|nr:MAG: peptide chain release factor N(5)-glutamine methyltransferase [Elusimicrobiota bacterium]
MSAGTVGEWLAKAEKYLDERGVPEARASAEFLMAEMFGVSRPAALLQSARGLTVKETHQYWDWIKWRGKRLPVAYILGHQPFLGIKIEVTRDSLVPRPETEELVLECERLLKKVATPKILEIGTGTGCIAIALAQLLPSATIFATDLSKAALDLAQKNAIAQHVGNRIRFVREDLFSDKQGLRGWADLLVSNPPYIPTKDLDGLDPEVQREPRLALDGGKDGLDAVRAIAAMAPKMLKPGGALAMEIGSKQGPAVAKLYASLGFKDIVIKKDLQGLERFAFGLLPA